ncbi:MAG: phosphoribosylanthranilate isomerase [Haloferacaceae archaeon]
MTRVKVCGVTAAADLRAVDDVGADAVGVITDVPVETPREVTPDHAAELVAAASPFLTTALVLMPESPDHAVDLADVVRPDVLQLHADFDADELRFVRAESGASVVPVVDADDPERARAYDDVADAIVVDSTSDDGAGGTGETHDWTATRDLAAALSTPVVLAGGLTPANVAEAVETVAPYAVDVASGVESTGGRKDHEAVEAFVRNARRREVTA